MKYYIHFLVVCVGLTMLSSTLVSRSYRDLLTLRPDIKYVTRFANNVYAVVSNNIIVSVDTGEFTDLCDLTCTGSYNPNIDFIQTTTIQGIGAVDDAAGARGVAVLVENGDDHQVYFAPTVGVMDEPQLLIFDTTPFTPSIPLALRSVPFSQSFTSSSDQVIGLHALRKENLVLFDTGKIFLSSKEGNIFSYDITPTTTTLTYVTSIPYTSDMFALQGAYGVR